VEQTAPLRCSGTTATVRRSGLTEDTNTLPARTSFLARLGALSHGIAFDVTSRVLELTSEISMYKKVLDPAERAGLTREVERLATSRT
jgi:hypothetical protein